MNEHNRGLEQGYGYPGRIEDFGVERDAWGIDARLGYTLRIQRLSGLLMPFVNFDMAGENNRNLHMGIRYDLANAGPAQWLKLELTGDRRFDRLRGVTHNTVELRGELRF